MDGSSVSFSEAGLISIFSLTRCSHFRRSSVRMLILPDAVGPLACDIYLHIVVRRYCAGMSDLTV